MKKKNKLLLLLLFFLFFANNYVSGQITIEPIDFSGLADGTTIDVEFVMSGMPGTDEFGTGQGTIEWDNDVLTFVSATANQTSAGMQPIALGMSNIVDGDKTRRTFSINADFFNSIVNGTVMTWTFTYDSGGTGDCGVIEMVSKETPISWAEIWGSEWTVTSNPNSVCGVSAPCTGVSISSQPANQTICTGDNTSLSVTASGDTPITYQWKYNNGGTWENVSNGSPAGASYSGTTTNTLNISGISNTGSYEYQCYLTNCSGADDVTSNTATLTVNSTPSITTQPSGATITEGDNHTFNVTASGGDLSFQWKKDGVNISSATSNSYSVTNATTADAGDYSCVVTNSCGTATSNDATLTVNTLTEITIEPIDFSGLSDGATIDVEFVMSGMPGSDEFGTGQGTVEWDNDVLTFVSATANQTAEGMQPIALGMSNIVDGDKTRRTFSINANFGNSIDNGTVMTWTFTYDSGGTGDCGVVEMVSAETPISWAEIWGSEWAVNSLPNSVCGSTCVSPAISTQPVGATICEGENHTFNITATGDGLNYQWKRGTTNVGSDSPSFTISGASLSDAGNYTCVVTGDCGTVTSNVATLTVNAATNITSQPNGATLCEGENHTFNVTATGDGLNYQWKRGTTNVGSDSPSFTISGASLSDAGNYTCVVTGDCGTITSNVATLTINTATNITSHPTTAAVCEGVNHTFTVTATGDGLNYQWKRGSTNVGTNSATLNINNVQTSDAGSYTCVVTGDCGTATSNAAVLTVNELAIAPTSVSATETTICDGESTTLSYSDGSGDAFEWYAGSCGGTPIGTGNSLSVTPTVSPTTYYGRWENSCGNSGCQSVTITFKDETNITTQPNGATICAGEDYTFTVAADGANLSYAWKRGTTYVGSDSPSLTISGASLADAGNYTCEVTGDCGTETSSIATLTVNALPTAATSVNASETSICAGGNTTLSYTGGSGDNFEWYSGTCVGASVGNGNNLDVSPSATTTYFGRWENACGESSCQSVIVTIDPATVITTQPTGETLCEGENHVFTVNATGSGLSYQWKQGTTNVGSNSNTLAISDATTADDGDYTCVVTGDCGVVTSNVATLTVNPLPAEATYDLDCSGGVGQGMLTIMSPTGTGYEYALNGGTYQSSTDFGPLANGSYTISVMSPEGCETIGTQFNIDCGCSNPTSLTLSETSASTCTYDAYTVSGNTFGGSATEVTLAHNGNGNLDVSSVTTSPFSFTYTPDPSDNMVTITLTTNNPEGAPCNASESQFILEVTPDVVIDAQPTGDAICEGEDFVLSISASGDNLTYEWELDGVAITGGDAASLTINNATTDDAGNYTCTVYGDCYATGVESNVAELIVNPIPEILSVTDAERCGNGQLTLEATASSGTIQWFNQQTGGSQLNTGASFTTPNLSETTSYYVQASENGCTSAPRVEVVATINDMPATPEYTEDCSGGAGNGAITVTAPTGAAYEYSLDGTTYQSSATFTSLANGAYTLYAQNINSGCTSETTVNLNCGCADAPTVTLAEESGATTDGTPVTLTGNTFGGSATEVTLTHNGAGTLDQSSFTSSPFEFTYTPAAGDVGNTVTITATTDDPDGADPCEPASDTYLLTVNPDNEIIITEVTASATEVCTGVEFTLSVSYTGGDGSTVNFAWTPADDMDDATISNPTVTPQTAGETTYTVTVSDDNYSDESSVVVTILQSPTADAGPDLALGCGYPFVQIGTEEVAGNSYLWTPSAGLSDNNIAMPNAMPDVTTEYTLVVTNDDNGCTDEDAVMVEIITGITADVTASETSICQGESVQLEGSSDFGQIFSWSPTTGLDNPNIENPVATPDETTTYELTATYGSCQETASVEITVTPTPEPTFTCSTDDICVGDTRELTADPAGGTFTLLNGDAEIVSNELIVNGVGTIEIQYEVSTNGCTGSSTLEITAFSIEEPSFETTDLTNICVDDTRDIIVSPEGGTFTITGPGTIEGTTLTATDVGDIVIEYTIEENACQASAQITITAEECEVEEPEVDFIINEGFSPNGDGIADSWIIQGLMEHYPNNEVIIYNRWGNEVFTASPYNNDWDGTYNGNLLPSGIYYYVLKLSENEDVRKGTIYINY